MTFQVTKSNMPPIMCQPVDWNSDATSGIGESHQEIYNNI